MLGRLPPSVLLFAVEAGACGPVADLSPDLESSLPELDRRLREVVEGQALALSNNGRLGVAAHPSWDREPSGLIPTGGPGDRPIREHRAKYPVVPWKSLALRERS